MAQSPPRPCPQDCARGTANCVVFSCPLYSFDRAAVLHVWGRLWNSTFLEVRTPLGAGLGTLFSSCPSGLTSPSTSSLSKCSTLFAHCICNFRCWGKVGLQAFQRVSLHVPLGVLSCEVPGGDCPSQYHREVLHQELAAQRCLHGGKLLQGWGAGAGASLSSLLWLLWLQPLFP